jgi:hypothetical protein
MIQGSFTHCEMLSYECEACEVWKWRKRKAEREEVALSTPLCMCGYESSNTSSLVSCLVVLAKSALIACKSGEWIPSNELWLAESGRQTKQRFPLLRWGGRYPFSCGQLYRVRALRRSSLNFSANHSIGTPSKTLIFLLLFIKNLKTTIIIIQKHVALLIPEPARVITVFAARISYNYAKYNSFL